MIAPSLPSRLRALACEQALWSGKERRKQTSEETGREWERKEVERLRPSVLFPSLRSARSAHLFSRFFPTEEPVHKLVRPTNKHVTATTFLVSGDLNDTETKPKKAITG